jgi:hypothetical protein
MSDQPVAKASNYTGQQKNEDKHACLEQDLNPRACLHKPEHSYKEVKHY